MNNYKLVYVAILCMVLLSLFSLRCGKDPVKPPPPPPLITKVDFVYTPANYEEGPQGATIFQPSASISNGVGIIMAHGTTGTRESVRLGGHVCLSRVYCNDN